MASGSTSAHSIQRRPGNSKKETSAARRGAEQEGAGAHADEQEAVASIASGRRPEKRESPPGATMKESGRPISGPGHEQRAQDRADGEAIEGAAPQSHPTSSIRLSASVEVLAGAVHVDRVALEVAELGDLGRRRARPPRPGTRGCSGRRPPARAARRRNSISLRAVLRLVGTRAPRRARTGSRACPSPAGRPTRARPGSRGPPRARGRGSRSW